MTSVILTDPYEIELESLLTDDVLTPNSDLEIRKDYHQKIAKASILARKKKQLISLRVA
jgi:hypothetical protein